MQDVVAAIAGTLGNALMAILLIAVFTLALSEFTRPWLRLLAQRSAFNNWWQLGSARSEPTPAPVLADEPALSESSAASRPALHPLLPKWLDEAHPAIASLLGTSVPERPEDPWAGVRHGSLLANDLCMRRVETVAAAVCQHPASAGGDFSFLASYATAEDRALVIALDTLGRADPDLTAELFPVGKRDVSQNEATRLTAVAAAQAAVAQSVQRHLDELQLALAARWSLFHQLAAPAIGIVVALVGALPPLNNALVAAPLGLLGGLVAGWLQSALGLFSPRRPG